MDSIELEEAKRILEENLVLDLDTKEGSRVGDIRGHLKSIRDEIEDLKKCFLESPEFLTNEEYERIPKIPINLNGIDELKKIHSETHQDNFLVAEVSAEKLYEVFLECHLLEFFTSNKTEEIPVSCQAKTFTDDINFFLNLQQSGSDNVEIPFTEINPSCVRIGEDSYFIQGESLEKFTKLVLAFYRNYFKSLKNNGGDASKVDLSSIEHEEKKDWFAKAIIGLLNFFNGPTEEQEESFCEEVLSDYSLECFLKNRKKIVIKKVWA